MTQVTEAWVEAASKAVVAEWQAMTREIAHIPRHSSGDIAREFVSPGNHRLIRAALEAILPLIDPAGGGEGKAGASEAFTALDLADKLIERAYGSDIPKEWNKAYRGVAKARSALPPASDSEKLIEAAYRRGIDTAKAAVQSVIDDQPSHDPGICLDMALRAIDERTSNG